MKRIYLTLFLLSLLVTLLAIGSSCTRKNSYNSQRVKCGSKQAKAKVKYYNSIQYR